MIVDSAGGIKRAWLAERAGTIGVATESRIAEAGYAIDILGLNKGLGARGAALGVLLDGHERQRRGDRFSSSELTNHVVDGVGKRVAIARRVVQSKHGRCA